MQDDDVSAQVPPPPGVTAEQWGHIVKNTAAFVRQHMSLYDSSHDWSHIQRVLSLACLIYNSESSAAPSLQQHLVLLAALLHDIGDKKYLAPGQDASTMVGTFLTSLACPQDLAYVVQDIVTHVSYSNEMRHPEDVAACLSRHPELGIVQDADRLDAIGAVGIGRCFTFSATQAARLPKGPGPNSMTDSILHFNDKLVRLESLMKTATGRRMARERTERISLFQAWWAEENTAVSSS